MSPYLGILLLIGAAFRSCLGDVPAASYEDNLIPSYRDGRKVPPGDVAVPPAGGPSTSPPLGFIGDMGLEDFRRLLRLILMVQQLRDVQHDSTAQVPYGSGREIGWSGLVKSLGSTEATRRFIDTLTRGSTRQAGGATQLTDGASQQASGATQQAGGATQQAGSATQQAGSATQLTGGATQQASGAFQLTGGPTQQASEAPQQGSGVSQLTGDANQQSDGAFQQVSGASQLTGDAIQNAGGSPQLTGGAPQQVGGVPQQAGGAPLQAGGALEQAPVAPQPPQTTLPPQSKPAYPPSWWLYILPPLSREPREAEAQPDMRPTDPTQANPANPWYLPSLYPSPSPYDPMEPREQTDKRAAEPSQSPDFPPGTPPDLLRTISDIMRDPNQIRDEMEVALERTHKTLNNIFYNINQHQMLKQILGRIGAAK